MSYTYFTWALIKAQLTKDYSLAKELLKEDNELQELQFEALDKTDEELLPMMLSKINAYSLVKRIREHSEVPIYMKQKRVMIDGKIHSLDWVQTYSPDYGDIVYSSNKMLPNLSCKYRDFIKELEKWRIPLPIFEDLSHLAIQSRAA